MSSTIAPTVSSAETRVNDIATKIGGRVHLRYLDSLRALAAVYVVFHHAETYGIGNRVGQYPRLIRHLYPLFIGGHYAVGLFIVLSGYCLMIPVAKSEDKRLPNGFWDYLRRRAWRILPAYYATLVLSVVLVWIAMRIGSQDSTIGTVPGMVAHLLLVQNLSGVWWLQLNPALWSVATEWQIYFFFPFFLMPIWRRFGMRATIFITWVLTTAPYFIFRNQCPLAQAAPWYLSLFAMGMGAAYLNFSSDARAESLRGRIPWRVIPAVLILSAIVLGKIFAHQKQHWIEDSIVGLLAATFLAYLHWCMTASDARCLPLPLRALNGDLLFNVGQFSYSIYLLNMPLLDLMHGLVRHDSVSPTVRFFVVNPAEACICVGAAYLLYLVFERPFLNNRYKRPPLASPTGLHKIVFRAG